MCTYYLPNNWSFLLPPPAADPDLESRSNLEAICSKSFKILGIWSLSSLFSQAILISFKKIRKVRLGYLTSKSLFFSAKVVLFVFVRLPPVISFEGSILAIPPDPLDLTLLDFVSWANLFWRTGAVVVFFFLFGSSTSLDSPAIFFKCHSISRKKRQ